ncbi:MAG TPA: heavy-metal-associated domain-containing protein [Rhizobacter sp.]|nr:heavy-metal-associated domain-containing protein [Rhizobacter sp.]
MFELTLPTMNCGGCARTVTEAVRQLDPAATLNIDLERHTVQIESQRPVEDFRAALAQEGYASAP